MRRGTSGCCLAAIHSARTFALYEQLTKARWALSTMPAEKLCRVMGRCCGPLPTCEPQEGFGEAMDITISAARIFMHVDGASGPLMYAEAVLQQPVTMRDATRVPFLEAAIGLQGSARKLYKYYSVLMEKGREVAYVCSCGWESGRGRAQEFEVRLLAW